MNGGKAMYLVECLTPYFAHARSVQVYATKVVGRTMELQVKPDTLPSALKCCCIEDVLLEFDHLLVRPGSFLLLSPHCMSF